MSRAGRNVFPWDSLVPILKESVSSVSSPPPSQLSPPPSAPPLITTSSPCHIKIEDDCQGIVFWFIKKIIMFLHSCSNLIYFR